MTEIILHGILAKKFKKKVKVFLGRMSDLVNCLDSILPNFRKTILDLNSKGHQYCFERKDGKIHILPVFCGSGKIAKIIAIVVLVIIIIVCIVVLGPVMAGAYAGAAAAGGTGAGVAAAAGVVTAGSLSAAGAAAVGAGAISAAALNAAVIGLSLSVSLLFSIATMKIQPTKDVAKALSVASGGTVATITTSNSKSYTFANKENIAKQGISVPIGYGRKKIPSRIIQIGIKNYRVNSTFENESKNQSNYLIND